MALVANKTADEAHLKSTQEEAQDVTEGQSSGQKGTLGDNQATTNVSSEEEPVSRTHLE